MIDAPMFELFERTDREAENAKARESRQRSIQDHLRSLRCCWPEWDGPRAGGLCSVDGCIAYSLTHRGTRYHMSAPCRLLFQIDEWTWVAVVEYLGDTHCRCYTGELLRLDITDIWAPVAHLVAVRREGEGE